MFVDGVVHANIARNMAEGYGSFWRPYHTATEYVVFYGHPPLGFWLQSWAFRLCGDAPVVETVWGCGLGLVIALGLASIWRCLTPATVPLAGVWWPVGLWVLLPMTSWIVGNNMLDTTLTVFVVLAVWLCLRGLQYPRLLGACGYEIGAGLCLVAGGLTKGPVAFFPLVVPGCFLLYEAQAWRRTLALWGVLCATCLVVAGLLGVTTPAARAFFQHYWHEQILLSLGGGPGIIGTRWAPLHAVGREIAVPLLIGGLLTWLRPWTSSQPWPAPQRRLLLCYLGIALAGSLPLSLSLKQHRWYTFPSLAFYVLAVAVLWNNAALHLERWLQAHVVWRRRALLGAALVGGLALLLMGLARHVHRRDVAVHQALAQFVGVLPARTMVSVYPAHLMTNLTLMANLQRSYKVGVTSALDQPYLLTTQGVLPEALAARYTPVPQAQAGIYRLFRATGAATTP